MNACAQNRKRIAMLTVNALKERDAVEVRRHLDQCRGCHDYWRELAGICAEHEAASRELPEVVPSRQFHDRFSQRIHHDENKTIRALAIRFLRLWFGGWRLAIPAGAVALLAFVCWPRSTNQPALSRPMSVASTTPVAVTTRDLPPTFSTYRTTVNRSLEALDDLLTRQGARRPWSPEALKASVIASDDLRD